MKTAIVHYWLTGMRGGEKVLEELCRLHPEATIVTHAYDPEAVSDTIRRHEVRETFIARLPGGRRNPQRYLPLMPRALEALDMEEFDLVISSEAGPAKGVVTRPDALHLCYCHSPMRYIWDQFHIYRADSGLAARAAMSLFAPRLRRWDMSCAARVDAIAANSAYVARRISKAWGRRAEVIHPPVDFEGFAPAPGTQPEDYWLWVGELVSYKRPELAIEAFTRSGRRLVVIGDGAQRRRLEASAGANVQFLGRVSAEVLKDHSARCRGLVYPGVEDFGITPLEVMAAGRPVVGFARGGLCETNIEGVTGQFFREQSPHAVIAAIERAEAWLPDFRPEKAMAHAAGFGAKRFCAEFSAFAARAEAAVQLKPVARQPRPIRALGAARPLTMALRPRPQFRARPSAPLSLRR
ncbi:MAG: glycosyltransferase [Vannielia sp.]|uniref:glycosyltransferase n=1 Tax=Vannielia sp. TaxID=2813045 RepID=UPI003B8C8AD3